MLLLDNSDHVGGNREIRVVVADRRRKVKFHARIRERRRLEYEQVQDRFSRRNHDVRNTI